MIGIQFKEIDWKEKRRKSKKLLRDDGEFDKIALVLLY